MASTRTAHNPGWVEIVLGVVLSLLLGAVLAALFLVLKPVATVKEIPAEPASDVVYYIEGTRDSGRARQASAKQRAFLQGEAIVLNEDELNALVAPSAAKPAPDAEAAPEAVTAGTPNFRIRDGLMQIGVPLRVSAAGVDQRVIVQAKGDFERRGESWVFAPTEMYVGSCPVQRLPFAKNFVMKKFMSGASVPEDFASAWSKVQEAKLEGSTLQLTL